MTYAALGRIHAELIHALSTLRDDESGQGTVEYIALVVLMGGIFALVAQKGASFGVADTIKTQLNEAIAKVAGGK